MYVLVIVCAVYIIGQEMKKPVFSMETVLTKIFGAFIGLVLVALIAGGM